MKNGPSVKCCGFAGLYGLALALFFFAGCGRPTGEVFPTLESPIVWPEPPEQGRIRFVGIISTEGNLQRGVSWMRGLGELIFGKEKMGALQTPSAITMGADGRLYIADSSGGVIHMFDLSKRHYEQFGSLSGDETLMMPVALTAIDERLYVVDSVLHQVCIFDGKGRFRGKFGSERLIRPSGIAYHANQDKLFVSDTGGHIINVFDKSGEFIETIGSRGVGPGRFNFPTQLWVDTSGRLYVSDTLNYRVQVLSHEGKFLQMFGEHGDRPGYFAHPAGIAVDSLGHIYVTDRQYESLQIFDSKGEILMVIGHEGTGLGEFWLPAGVYIDKRNRIYVADSFNNRIQVFELLEVGEDEQ
jgi:DNA-binding beta-propeller fold protein YncE